MKSRIIALMAVEMMTVPVLALNWGQFDRGTAISFLLANAIWQFFVLSPLFEWYKQEPKK